MTTSTEADDGRDGGAVAVRFSGRFFTAEDEGYEAARVHRVYNGRRNDRRPAAVLQAVDERDVVEGVRLAAERGWQVGVRSGGHSYPMWGVRNDALLIDLSRFREVTYDERTTIVSATAASEGGNDVNSLLELNGRFFGGGVCASVGLGGFLLQGGIGWNFRGWGWAAEQIVAVDVVTATGDVLRVDAEHHPDLFWAARGGGPGFPSVVLRFHLRTRLLPPAMITTRQHFPLRRYVDVLEWLGTTQLHLSEDVHLTAMTIEPDAATALPGHTGGPVLTVSATAFAGSRAAAEAALAPLGENPFLSDALLVEDPSATSMRAEYAFMDKAEPPGRRYRADSAWVTGPHRAVAEAALTAVAERPDPDSGYTFFQWALPRSQPDMAADLRTELMVGVIMMSDDPAADEQHAQWLRAAMRPLEAFTAGQYWGDSDQEHRRVKCFTDDAWQRMQAVRRSWDPERRFVDYPTGPQPFRNENEWEQPRVASESNLESR